MTPRRWALLALALVGAGTALVWQDVSPPSAAPPDAGVDARAKVLVDTAEHCEAIRGCGRFRHGIEGSAWPQHDVEARRNVDLAQPLGRGCGWHPERAPPVGQRHRPT